MLVWPDRVVPKQEFIQNGLQLLCGFKVDTVQVLFKCAKQSFYAPVLPWAMHIAALHADALQFEWCGVCLTGKAAFVIGAYKFWPTVALGCLCCVPSQTQRVLAGNKQLQ
jgi:hypothetical protein